MSDKAVQISELDVNEIMKLIPHRYPFLMIDKVVDVVMGESAIGEKAVSVAEPHFQGHFPQRPIMPGVLIVEAMAQTAGVLVVHSLGEGAMNKLVYFMTIDSARFRKPVVPHVDRLVEYPSGTRQLLQELGPEAFCSWVRQQKSILYTR